MRADVYQKNWLYFTINQRKYLLTRYANSLAYSIHEPMPVILRLEDKKVWLNTELQETEKLKRLLDPYVAYYMEDYHVSSDVNSPKNNHKGLFNSLLKKNDHL